MSVQAPDFYADRFMGFMREIMLPNTASVQQEKEMARVVLTTPFQSASTSSIPAIPAGMREAAPATLNNRHDQTSHEDAKESVSMPTSTSNASPRADAGRIALNGPILAPSDWNSVPDECEDRKASLGTEDTRV